MHLNLLFSYNDQYHPSAHSNMHNVSINVRCLILLRLRHQIDMSNIIDQAEKIVEANGFKDSE